MVAHRGGNRISDLRAAERLGAALVEADVRLFRGRLEVRHLKSVGPLPLFWDRWRLAVPWRRRLQLHELVAATAPETELMLDLKGSNERLAERVFDTIRPCLPSRLLTVCARDWKLLEAFVGSPVRRVHSVGTPRELRRLLSRFADERLQGVSIHERLVDRDSMVSLRRIADVLMTWPVNRVDRARELLTLGVDGLITDDAETISGVALQGSPA